jgi:hypothetical protein
MFICEINELKGVVILSKVLECSSKGDKRFSAFYAKVNINGVCDSIENHYQLSKRFGNDVVPKHWKQCKGRKPTHFVVNNIRFELNEFSIWYKVLWLKYFIENPELLVYINKFDDFNDMFKGKALNCQADVIRDIAKKGFRTVFEECAIFFNKVIVL